MKKFLLTAIVILLAASAFTPTPVYADWSYGTAHFKGSQPSNCLNHGGVLIYYNGSLKQTGTSGTTEIWECTGDVCIIYPKNYRGYKIQMKASGNLQVQYL